MHHDEMWQVYAPNGEPIVGEGWNSALGNPEKTGSSAIVGVAVVFLYRYNDDGELEKGVFIPLQWNDLHETGNGTVSCQLAMWEKKNNYYYGNNKF